MNDLISRQLVMKTLCERRCGNKPKGCPSGFCTESLAVDCIPSAQPTLYGYEIEHLKLIAIVLQKENLPPERVAEAIDNISRIAEIVHEEFAETLRKAVEQCKI